MDKDFTAFVKLLKHPLKSRLFLLSKLPSAFFAGVRVQQIDEGSCAVSVPYKWFTKNPFRSIYFACLAMAAEMSTGALSMAYSYHKKNPVSMLVVNIESSYFKKAIGRIEFRCDDGLLIRDCIAQAIQTGTATSVRARSVGRNAEGISVAEFFVTWSFRIKQQNVATAP